MGAPTERSCVRRTSRSGAVPEGWGFTNDFGHNDVLRVVLPHTLALRFKCGAGKPLLPPITFKRTLS
jgi:hypothetical protein